MPHYRHPVTAKDESLNIGEIEYGFRGCSRVSIRRGDVMSASAEHATEESSALLCRWLQCLAFLAHCSFLHDPSLATAVPQQISRRRGGLAIKPLRTSTCYRRSGHGCPEP